MTAMRKKWKYRLWIPVVALGLMNILAMKPARKGRVSMDVIQEYDYAHRGLYNVREGIAENTLLLSSGRWTKTAVSSWISI